MSHAAACRCGKMRLTAEGDPVRVSVCHCRNCQQRSGSAFAAQVRFPREAVTIEGEGSIHSIAGDSGNIADFHFCPTCGATLYFVNRVMPETVAVPLGLFADPYVFRPHFSVYENRKHDWVAIIGDGIEHD